MRIQVTEADWLTRVRGFICAELSTFVCASHFRVTLQNCHSGSVEHSCLPLVETGTHSKYMYDKYICIMKTTALHKYLISNF
jgi:hypothetical protein